MRRSALKERSIQPVLRFETLGDVLLGDVGNVFGDERLDFHFEAVVEQVLDFLLPALVPLEPWVGCDFLGSLDVVLRQVDLDGVRQFAVFVIL